MDPRPTLVVNPRSDPDFQELAERLANEAQRPDQLQAALRAVYPLVVVHERQLSAEWIRVWYVYRDGRWVRPDQLEPEREHD